MDDFSQEFETGFMQLMSHSYRSTRILANTVYCEFISNRHHTHMNSTIWVTLSNFVQYLGRTNQCKIDKTPKGWYLQYVDNTPEARMREEKARAMERTELADEVRHERMLAQQVQEAGEFEESEFTELQRNEGDAPIAFAMSSGFASAPSASSSSTARAVAAGAAAMAKQSAAVEGNVLESAFEAHSSSSTSKPFGSATSVAGAEATGKVKEPRKLSAMEAVRLEHEAKKRRTASPQPSSPSSEGAEPWLSAGLIVKVMHQELNGGKYYRKKGLIEKVHNQFTADVRMTDSKDLIRLEQELLETVIPNVGKMVRVVKGTHKGRRATMRAVDFEGFCVTVELDDGTVMEGLGYDEVCKFEER